MPLLRFLLLPILVGVVSMAMASPSPKVFHVELRPLQQRVSLFAKVVASQPVSLSANASGRLSGFSLVVGDRVAAGQMIGRLESPTSVASQASAEQAFQQDEKDVAFYRRRLQLIQQKQHQRFATEANVLELTQQLSDSESRLAIARMHLDALRQESRILAPVAGQIVAIKAGEGDHLTPGQAIATIQPDKGLWLRAETYGEQGFKLAPGDSGQFRAESSGRHVSVEVVSRYPDPSLPGRWWVDLKPARVPVNWFPGEFGELRLTIKSRQLPAVPTSALILDAGTWWVMQEIAGKATPVEVSLAATQQGWSWIRKGLSPGDRVVIDGAYALYHKDFSSHYSNPD